MIDKYLGTLSIVMHRYPSTCQVRTSGSGRASASATTRSIFGYRMQREVFEAIINGLEMELI